MSVSAKPTLKKIVTFVIFTLTGCLIVLQFIARPTIVNPPVTGDIDKTDPVVSF